MKLSAMTLVLLSSFALITGCSEDKDTKKPPPKKVESLFSGFFAEPSSVITVVDTEGHPVVGAQVLIGSSVGSPFAENFITTDDHGTFVAPADWTDAQPVTINSAGSVRTTYLGQTPQGQKFEIRYVPANERLELSGKGTGFNIKDKDNKIDFALMIHALNRTALFSFNLDMVISNEMDTISVMGQEMDLPSNIALPKQKETYILPITLEKEKYRLYFNEKGTKRVYTARGQFPFKEVVKELRNNTPFHELINYFSLLGGSIKTVTINGPKQTLDLPVNELVFNQARKFKAPTFANDEFIMALALSEHNAELFPTDIKNITAGKETSLSTAAGSNPLLLTVLKKKDENALGAGRLSAAITQFDAATEPKMLPLMANPQVTGPYEVTFPKIATVNTVEPVATFSVLSKLEKKTVNNLQIEVLTPEWEVYGETWVEGFKLPEWPGDAPKTGTHRWDVSFVGSQTAKTIDLGPRMLETATHATHSSTDF